MFDRNRYDRWRMNLETTSTHSSRRRSLSILTSIHTPQMKKSAAEKKVPAATARKAKAPTKGAAAKKQSIPNKDKAPKQPSTKGGRGGGGDKVVAKAYDKATHHASSGGAAKNEHLKVPLNIFSGRRTPVKFPTSMGQPHVLHRFSPSYFILYPNCQCRHDTSTHSTQHRGSTHAHSMMHMEWCHTTQLHRTRSVRQIQSGWVRFLRKEFTNGRPSNTRIVDRSPRTSPARNWTSTTRTRLRTRLPRSVSTTTPNLAWTNLVTRISGSRTL